MTEMETKRSVVWREFLRRHWKAVVLLVAGAIVAAVGAVLVFLWFAGQAQVTGLVPVVLSFWTMGELISFLVGLALWELLLIGIPVAIACIIVYAAYRRLPPEEREEYRRAGLFRIGSRGRNYGSGFTFVINLLFVLKVYLDGNWNLPFSNWTFDYLVDSYVWILLVLAALFAIPALIVGSWWLRREIRSR